MAGHDTPHSEVAKARISLRSQENSLELQKIRVRQAQERLDKAVAENPEYVAAHPW